MRAVTVPDQPMRPALPGRTWAWAAVTGLFFGASGSVLNHVSAVGPLAAVVGSGAGWFVAGVAAAAVLRARHSRTPWPARAAVVALQYALACASYYLSDWLYALPALRRLQEDVRAGRVPDPGPFNLAPDWPEWLFWSATAVPAGLLATATVTGVAGLARRARRQDALPRR